MFIFLTCEQLNINTFYVSELSFKMQPQEDFPNPYIFYGV